MLVLAWITLIVMSIFTLLILIDNDSRTFWEFIVFLLVVVPPITQSILIIRGW